MQSYIKILVFCFLGLSSISLFAQIPLPFVDDFNNGTPDNTNPGWDYDSNKWVADPSNTSQMLFSPTVANPEASLKSPGIDCSAFDSITLKIDNYFGCKFGDSIYVNLIVDGLSEQIILLNDGQNIIDVSSVFAFKNNVKVEIVSKFLDPDVSCFHKMDKAEILGGFRGGTYKVAVSGSATDKVDDWEFDCLPINDSVNVYIIIENLSDVPILMNSPLLSITEFFDLTETSNIEYKIQNIENPEQSDYVEYSNPFWVASQNEVIFKIPIIISLVSNPDSSETFINFIIKESSIGEISSSFEVQIGNCCSDKAIYENGEIDYLAFFNGTNSSIVFDVDSDVSLAGEEIVILQSGKSILIEGVFETTISNGFFLAKIDSCTMDYFPEGNKNKTSKLGLDEISIYPNPVSDFLFLSFDSYISADYKVVICDASGKIVMSFDYKVGIGINVSNLKAGLYKIFIEGLNDVYYGKFIRL